MGALCVGLEFDQFDRHKKGTRETLTASGGGANVMRQHDLVEANVGHARSLALEADNVGAIGRTREAADDAAARARWNVAVPVEKANDVARAKLGKRRHVRRIGHSRGLRMSVEDPGIDGGMRGAPHLQQQIELDPSTGRVQRPELRYLDLLRPNAVRGHMNVRAHEREQARDKVSIGEMDPHVPQDDDASLPQR